MKKRVTYGLAFLLLVSLASAPSDVGAQGPGEEKNINIRIVGDDEGERHILVGDDKNVKVVTEGETCAFIGINMEDLTEKIIGKLGYPKKTGVLITSIVDDSAAEKFGLMKDDIIFSFDGKKLASSEQLAELVREKKPGDKVDVVYYRDGKKKEQEIELGERSYKVMSMDWNKYEDAVKLYAKSMAKVGKNAFVAGHDWIMSRGRLGLVLKDLDEDMALYFDRKAGEGVLVIDVNEESPAEEAGVKSGDIIVGVSGKEVSSVDEFLDEVYDCMDKDEVELDIVRKGGKKSIKVEVSDELHRMMFVPGERMKRIEVFEDPVYKLQFDETEKGIYEKKALEKEIEALKKQLERLEKRLDKIEKE
jgi:C-terminal processing protease CtpA/Prc